MTLENTLHTGRIPIYFLPVQKVSRDMADWRLLSVSVQTSLHIASKVTCVGAISVKKMYFCLI